MNELFRILNTIRPEFDFENSEDFIADGYLDSFDLVTLVAEIEERYDCLIDALDIVPENFISCKAILATIVKNGGTVENG